MTKESRYEKAVRMIAMDLKEGMIFTQVVIEDVTLRGEKTILKNLIKKYERQVSENKLFDLDNSTNNKVLTILNSRLNKVNTF